MRGSVYTPQVLYISDNKNVAYDCRLNDSPDGCAHAAEVSLVRPGAASSRAGGKVQ